MNSIKDLPAFPPVSLTKEQAEKLAQIAKEAREKYEKNKAEELLTEIEKAKSPLTTYLKNKAGGEE